MEILIEVKRLKDNSLLRSDQEMDEFENAIENIFSLEDYRNIRYLCSGFNDNTENEEVMFGLLHAIEDYLQIACVENYLKEFISSIPYMYGNSKYWTLIMNKRILNNEQVLEKYILVARNCDNKIKKILIDIMHEIEKDNPKRFSDTVNKFINGIS